MPLFGSQRKTNKRLFDKAYLVFAQNIDSQDWERQHKNSHMAWFAGGSVAANCAVDSCEPLKARWAKGDERATVSLALVFTIIFTMPMVLRFFHWTPSMRVLGLQRRLELVQGALGNVLHIVGGHPLPPNETVAEYMEIAKQYDFEEDACENETGSPLPHWIEMDYLLSKSLRALGHKSAFALGASKLPVPSLYEFTRAGGVPGMSGNDIEIYAAMFDSVHSGVSVSAKVMNDLLRPEGVTPHA